MRRLEQLLSKPPSASLPRMNIKDVHGIARLFTKITVAKMPSDLCSRLRWLFLLSLAQQHLAFLLGLKLWWPTWALTRKAEKTDGVSRPLHPRFAAFSDGVFLGSGLKSRPCIPGVRAYLSRPIELHCNFSHAALCFSSNASFKR